MNNILQPGQSYSKMYGTEPRYNDPRYNVWVNSKSDHPPPGQTPGHLTFLKMLDQIPPYMGRFQGQMPHWLRMKSENVHNFYPVMTRELLKKYSAHKVRHKDQKAQTKVLYVSVHPMDPKSLCIWAGDFI